jgi:hypothetical protein
MANISAERRRDSNYSSPAWLSWVQLTSERNMSTLNEACHDMKRGRLLNLMTLTIQVIAAYSHNYTTGEIGPSFVPQLGYVGTMPLGTTLEEEEGTAFNELPHEVR